MFNTHGHVMPSTKVQCDGQIGSKIDIIAVEGAKPQTLNYGFSTAVRRNLPEHNVDHRDNRSGGALRAGTLTNAKGNSPLQGSIVSKTNSNVSIRVHRSKPGGPIQRGDMPPIIPPPSLPAQRTHSTSATTTKPNYRDAVDRVMPSNGQTATTFPKPTPNSHLIDDKAILSILICPYHRRSGEKTRNCDGICIYDLLRQTRVCPLHRKFQSHARNCQPPYQHAGRTVRLINLFNDNDSFIPLNFFLSRRIHNIIKTRK